MTPPIRPESSNPRLNNLRKIEEGYRAQGATADEIAELIRTYHPELQAQAPEPMGAWDNVRGGVQAGLQGLTFNWGDEAVGALRGMIDRDMTIGEGIADERANLNRFREENPKTALGTELAGGLLAGGGLAKLAQGTTILGKAVGGIKTGLGTAGTVAASGLGGGAAAGAGAGETPMERTLGAAGGGLLGGVLGYGAAKVAPAWLSSVAGDQQVTDDLLARLGTAPGSAGVAAAQQVSGPVSGQVSQNVPRGTGQAGFSEQALLRAKQAIGDTKEARSLLDVLEQAGVGADVMPADLGVGAQRGLRAAANLSPAGEGLARTRLGERGAQVGGRVRGALTRATGLTPEATQLGVDDLVAQRAAKARPLYAKALDVGDIAPERTSMRAAKEAVPESALAKMDDAELEDELTRMMEAQALDEGELAGLHDTPEFAEYSGMPGKEMREDRRGVLTAGGKQIGDAQRDLAMNAGRVKQRQPRIDALRAEIERRAGAFDPFGGMPDESAMGLDALIESPIVRSAIAQAKALPQYAKLADTDMKVLDRAYKNLGGKLRAAQRAGDGALAHDLGEMQSALLAELSERNPAYRTAVTQFADDSRLKDAYEMGTAMFNKPVGDIQSAMAKMTPDEIDLFKRGAFDALVEGRVNPTAPNPRLGEAARQSKAAGQIAVNTDAAADRFRAIFGDDALGAVEAGARAEGTFTRTAAEALQNSTTAKQLADMESFGGLANVEFPALTSPSWWARTGGKAMDAGRRMVAGAAERGNPMARALVPQTNRELADVLTTPGADKARDLLALLDQLGIEREALSAAVQPGAAAVAGRSRGPR